MGIIDCICLLLKLGIAYFILIFAFMAFLMVIGLVVDFYQWLKAWK